MSGRGIAVALVLLCGTPAYAIEPVVAVVMPSATDALSGEDTTEVIIRASSDKPLTLVSITFDTDIGTLAAGTPITAKPPPKGGLTEVPLPVATELWGTTMTVSVSDGGGRTTTLIEEYSSVLFQ